MNSLDPWRVTQSSPPSDVMVVPAPYYGHPFIDERAGIFIGAELLPRANLTAVLAPVLAPATGGFTARVELDHEQHLHAAICVDGKCYQTSIDLAPAIAAVMAKIALAHADMHASMAHAPMISGDVAIGAVDEAVSAAGDALIGTLIGRHRSVACAGWLDDIGDAIKGAGVSVYRGVTETVQKLKGPIATVATVAATAFGGPAAGAAAAKFVGPVIDSAANLGKDTPAKAAAEQQAKTDPATAAALSAAKEAVAHTVAAFHVTETAKQAAAGHPAAQQQIAAVVQDAEKGDPAAHAVTDLIANAFSTTGAARRRTAPAAYQPTTPTTYRPAPAPHQTAPAAYQTAPATYQTAPAAYQTAPSDYRHPATYQQTASRAVARAQHKRQQQNLGPVPAFGYLRQDKHHKVYFFNSPGEAESWYAALTPGYSYAALFDAQNLAAPLAENFGGAGPAVSGEPWQSIVGDLPWQSIIGADAFDLPDTAMDQYRRAAIDAVKHAYHKQRAPLLGYRRAGSKQSVYLFKSLRDATAWYQHPTSGYSYAAFFDANDFSSPLAEDFSEVFFASYPASVPREIAASGAW